MVSAHSVVYCMFCVHNVVSWYILISLVFFPLSNKQPYHTLHMLCACLYFLYYSIYFISLCLCLSLSLHASLLTGCIVYKLCPFALPATYLLQLNYVCVFLCVSLPQLMDQLIGHLVSARLVAPLHIVMCVCVYIFIQSPTHSFVHSSVHPLTSHTNYHLLAVHTLTHSLTHSFIYSTHFFMA